MNKPKLKQIWVMWSAADLWYEDAIENTAFRLWELLAKNSYVLVYWAEKDSDSLSTAAARWTKSKWWLTVWVTYWRKSDIWWEMADLTDVIVCTWMDRWGWREFVLVSSCDAIITVWGWSGTLNEVTVAYQKKIPIVNMTSTWWWSDKLAWTYLDERAKTDPQRYICKWASSPEEAIDYINSIRDGQ